MKILVTGGKGLLAHAIRELAPTGMELICWDVEEFDLSRPEIMWQQLRALRPDWVINTAAYNLVDRCEVERELSWTVNARGPELLAGFCLDLRIPMVHFSSDYVFDGGKTLPYEESDLPNPLNHYGAGKLHGEQAVLSASDKNLVLRTSWLFGLHPFQAKSYVHAVVRQAMAGKPLKATTDQVAAPTYAPDLAFSTVSLIREGAVGLFHAVNDEGLSRYDWTLGILAEARRSGVLKDSVVVGPVLTAFFGSTMRRPSYSVLSNRKLASRLSRPPGSWRRGVREMLVRFSEDPKTWGPGLVA